MTQESFRILLFGGSGQVGSELRRRPWPMPVTLHAPGRAEADFCNAAGLAAIVSRLAPDLVVNAAAYTAVDKAEAAPDLAHALNAIAPAALAWETAALGIPLIHLSTDYVFDGSKPAPYEESDPVNPISVYGASKAAGEASVREAAERHVILRTSWVYGAIGANFVKTMLRLGEERSELRVVDDQWGAPTSAADIADAVMKIAGCLADGGSEFGTFHYTADGATTWRRFAECIFAHAATVGARVPRIVPIPTEEYPTPAKRPRNSRLNCERAERVFGVARRPWAGALADVMTELCPGETKRLASVS
jgi:dTDP-4-dehydrorhamnose reductase